MLAFDCIKLIVTLRLSAFAGSSQENKYKNFHLRFPKCIGSKAKTVWVSHLTSEDLKSQYEFEPVR